MYGKGFSIGELLSSGYASLVNHGRGINQFNIESFFRSIPCMYSTHLNIFIENYF